MECSSEKKCLTRLINWEKRFWDRLLLMTILLMIYSVCVEQIISLKLKIDFSLITFERTNERKTYRSIFIVCLENIWYSRSACVEKLENISSTLLLSYNGSELLTECDTCVLFFILFCFGGSISCCHNFPIKTYINRRLIH